MHQCPITRSPQRSTLLERIVNTLRRTLADSFSSLHTMQFVDLVGWLASAVLIATLIRQIYKQWQSPAAQGVSRWLFVGQISASVLFIVYSYLVGNAVFIVSNALILLTAITGYVLQRIKHRQLRGIS